MQPPDALHLPRLGARLLQAAPCHDPMSLRLADHPTAPQPQISSPEHPTLGTHGCSGHSLEYHVP